jgi:hypothetical protein
MTPISALRASAHKQQAVSTHSYTHPQRGEIIIEPFDFELNPEGVA